jgi:4-amino-4-deoxychorismate lyase
MGATAGPAGSAPIASLIDGVPGETVPAWDRGLSYGDGLFETVLVRDGRPCQWARHRTRLTLGCRRLGIPAPAADLLESEVRLLTAGLEHAVLKVLVTRGIGGRGYRSLPAGEPRRILHVYPPPHYPAVWCEQGVVVRFCQTPASYNPALAGLKHLNRLDSVLARSEWDDPAIADGLMSGMDGEVVGGTMTNLFLWDGRSLLTPAVDRCGIAGTVRALTLELARARGVPCVVADTQPALLARAQGMFLTNSLVGVWPVRQLGECELDLGQLPLDLIAAITREAQSPGGFVA